MTNTVELCEVSKRYGGFVAVDALSFQVSQGGVYGLLGPNGAGKTSTLRMMIGTTAPDLGEVRLFGERFHRRHLARVGYLPEERGLYKRMEVLEHLVLLAELRGQVRAVARQQALRWCERLEIAAWARKRVEALSKGMQQKVQFIGAVLHDPDLLILDEPFSGLDPANANTLRDVLLEMKREGKTILFSSHRMDQVERLCDAICLVNRGKVVLEGELSSLKGRYGSNRVRLQYDGNNDFLRDQRLVQSFNDYGRFAEIQLQPDADPQELLRRALANARITEFALQEPSLEEIFLQAVGRPDA